jgi:V/A-type H+-transporting ATPase subunit D
MLNVAPTKTNLLKLRDELKFASLGHELLDQKRSILIVELLGLVDQTTDFQGRVEESLSKAYSTLEKAVLQMGKLKVQNLAGAVNIEANIRLGARKVMGVTLPIVETDFHEKPPYFSPMGTSFWIDSSMADFKSALQMLGKLAELKISVLRLANEVRKTIRKVNALEKIAIPDLEDTVSYIEYRLEENERDMFTLMKNVKERLVVKRKGTGHNRERDSEKSH